VSISISQVLKSLNERASGSVAESWDNVGLLIGDPNWKTKGAVVSIDFSPESIQAAKSLGYRLIVNHHPCIFPKQRGLSRITPDRLTFEALQNGIAVIASHTNFDRCALEVPEKIVKGQRVWFF
jgi:putative NIF3 family GTP cyclohydrolase 1 type 2